jgi:hypothetical protein
VGSPALTNTFIPHNMPSANEQSERVDAHFLEELAAARMSGPYTVDEAHLLFHGHFRTAPIGFIERPPGCGKWRMVQNLSARDHLGVSTNDWLDAKEHPTRWHTCAMFADMVNYLTILLPCFTHSCSYCLPMWAWTIFKSRPRIVCPCGRGQLYLPL